MERAHLRSSSRAKSSRFRFFAFTCRRVENPDSHKYVLGRRCYFLRASFPTFGYHQTLSAKNRKVYLGSNDAFILHAICDILNRNNKKIFHRIQVCLMILGKYSTDSSRSFQVLNNFRCYINIHFFTSRRGKIFNIAIFSLSFSLPIVKCFEYCAEGVNEIDNCPSPL